MPCERTTGVSPREAQIRIRELERELEETRTLLEQERLRRLRCCQQAWFYRRRIVQGMGEEPPPSTVALGDPGGAGQGAREESRFRESIPILPCHFLERAAISQHDCRDMVLEAIGLAAEQFLRNSDLRWNIQSLLSLLGWATKVSRVYIFENTLDDGGTLLASYRYEWVAQGIAPQIDNPTLQRFPYLEGGFARWQKILSRGGPIYGEIDTLPPEEQQVLKLQDILSILVVPIFVGANWWGFLGFDDCVCRRRWTSSEIDALRIAAGLIGGAIQRHEILAALQKSELSLRQAYSQLEQRVAERTADLQAANQALKREIAERQHAEERLHFQARLLEAVGQAVIATRLDGTIVYWNRAAETLFGWTPAEAIGQNIGLLSDQSCYGSCPHPTEAAEISWCGEMLARHRDGHTFPVFATDAPIIDEQGNVSGIIRVATDITDRKRSEQALAEREAHYRTLVETLPSAILLTDHHGMIQFCNQQTAELFGYRSVDELYGQQWTTFIFAPAHSECGFPSNPRAIAPTEIVRNAEYLLRRKDGSQFAGEISSSVVNNPHGEPLAFVIVIQDISERKKLQTMIIENERFAASGRLAASIAHEINTPLQSLDFSLEMAQIGPPEKRLVFLEDARQEIQRIARIVRQLLDLHRPVQSHNGPVCMNDLLERALLVTGKWIRDHKIVVRLELAESLPSIFGRADELMQVLINLLMNAVHAMSGGGILEIKTLLRDGMLVVEMSDTGMGIPPELIEHIFEPFVTTRDDGTGLGLPISRQIVEQHGGRITVHSVVNVGSTFTVLLPLSPPDDKALVWRTAME